MPIFRLIEPLGVTVIRQLVSERLKALLGIVGDSDVELGILGTTSGTPFRKQFPLVPTPMHLGLASTVAAALQ